MNTKFLILVFISFLIGNEAMAQLAIGTDIPQKSAILEVASPDADQALMLTRVTNDSDVEDPVPGMMIFETSSNTFKAFTNLYGWSPLGEFPNSVISLPRPPVYLASIFDQDYLPYTTPTGTAMLPGVDTQIDNADGGNETVEVNFQGIIPVSGIEVWIPCFNPEQADATLNAFTQTITVSAEYTENSTPTDITLSYPSQTIPNGNGSIVATLQAVGSDLMLKKLDLNSGLGADFAGLLIGEFAYPTNDVGGEATLEIRIIPGLPDAKFGDGSHDFIYTPIASPSGVEWLNNNLGATYNNIHSGSFNPNQQATSSTDSNAYGNYFQWGRDSDGHEFSTSAILEEQATTDTPSHSDFIKNSDQNGDWRDDNNNNRWTTGVNDPCPVGYKVPSSSVLSKEFSAFAQYPIIDQGNFDHIASLSLTPLKFARSGYRDRDGNLLQVNSYLSLWTSDIQPIDGGIDSSKLFITISNTIKELNLNRTRGSAVRCVKQ